MSVEHRLAELGIDLPPVAAPVASYVPVVVSRGLAFVSGQLPMEEGKPLYLGRLGAEVSEEDGAAAARRCALQALAVLKAELGSLDRVKRIVKLTVWVASTEDFTAQPRVANGASEVLGEIFDDEGKHARASVSTPALPLGVPVEVEVLAEVT
jgi:enamine deaminase RidA (YjgF/YER057c/UK114 family)